MQIDGVRLGRLVIEHGRDGANVESAGSEVGGEKVGGVGRPEGFDRGDALLGKVSVGRRGAYSIQDVPALGSCHHGVQ